VSGGVVQAGAVRPRIEALTGLRGIAAWLVALYHVRLTLGGWLPESAIAALAKGYLAVDLFFLLSGFVLWLTYAERFQRDGSRFYVRFLWRRLARVWPLHLLILGAFVGYALLLTIVGRPDQVNHPFYRLPLHILLVQNWGFTEQLRWNHPAWSISAEFAAYLLFPWIVIGLRLHRWRSAALVAGFGGLGLALHLIYASAGHQRIGDVITELGLVRCLIEFSMGMILSVLWQRGHGRSKPLMAAGGYLGVMLIATAFGLVETLAAPALLGLLLLCVALSPDRWTGWLARGPIHYLGTISYATYLAHYLLFILFKHAFVGPDLAVGPIGLAAFLGLLLLVSAALYHGWERPTQAWLNARAPRRGAPAIGPNAALD